MERIKVRWIGMLVALVFCFNMNVYATDREIELDSDEKVEYTEDDTVDHLDQYVDGIYNTNELARTGMTGVIRLGQSGTKVYGSYSTSYTYDVDKIGVKNITLQYKSSLKVWYTIFTFDNRYRTNASIYAGSFTTPGTIGRTYRLKATHYITDDGSTQTKSNLTGEMTFN